jgi:urease subunit beta/urease subunit gamma/beta
MIPGEWLLCDEPIEINASRRTCRISVRNTGDRAIQVGSHFHFFEVNRVLDFDRPAAFGMRLDVPSGQSIRFEAGDEREIDLVELGGTGRIAGFNNLVNGAISAPSVVQRAVERAMMLGFLGADGRDRPVEVDVGDRSVAEEPKAPHLQATRKSKSKSTKREPS